MTKRKVYRLNLTIALEASNSDEAYELLLSDAMSDQIKHIIKNSKHVIVEVMDKEKPLLS